MNFDDDTQQRLIKLGMFTPYHQSLFDKLAEYGFTPEHIRHKTKAKLDKLLSLIKVTLHNQMPHQPDKQTLSSPVLDKGFSAEEIIQLLDSPKNSNSLDILQTLCSEKTHLDDEGTEQTSVELLLRHRFSPSLILSILFVRGRTIDFINRLIIKILEKTIDYQSNNTTPWDFIFQALVNLGRSDEEVRGILGRLAQFSGADKRIPAFFNLLASKNGTFITANELRFKALLTLSYKTIYLTYFEFIQKLLEDYLDYFNDHPEKFISLCKKLNHSAEFSFVLPRNVAELDELCSSSRQKQKNDDRSEIDVSTTKRRRPVPFSAMLHHNQATNPFQEIHLDYSGFDLMPLPEALLDSRTTNPENQNRILTNQDPSIPQFEAIPLLRKEMYEKLKNCGITDDDISKIKNTSSGTKSLQQLTILCTKKNIENEGASLTTFELLLQQHRFTPSLIASIFSKKITNSYMNRLFKSILTQDIDDQGSLTTPWDFVFQALINVGLSEEQVREKLQGVIKHPNADRLIITLFTLLNSENGEFITSDKLRLEALISSLYSEKVRDFHLVWLDRILTRDRSDFEASPDLFISVCNSLKNRPQHSLNLTETELNNLSGYQPVKHKALGSIENTTGTAIALDTDSFAFAPGAAATENGKECDDASLTKETDSDKMQKDINETLAAYDALVTTETDLNGIGYNSMAQAFPHYPVNGQFSNRFSFNLFPATPSIGSSTIGTSQQNGYNDNASSKPSV